MIKNITLHNVASYKNKTVLNTDKKVNIIYGLNGTGKSTFSNYFYSLGQEKADYKLCSHNGENEKIFVYNQKFILDHFYDQDSLKGIFSLSKENKQAKEKINNIHNELKNIDEAKQILSNEIVGRSKQINDMKLDVLDQVWKIKTNYSGGDRVLEFCLKNKKGSKDTLFSYICSIPLLDKKLLKSIHELKKEIIHIEGESATKHTEIERLKYSELSNDDLDLLNEVILGSQDSVISNLINELKNADWVHDGLKYLEHSGEQCPFCQEKTLTTSLTQEISDYFDDSYKEKLMEIQRIYNQYISITRLPNFNEYKIGEIVASEIPQLEKYYELLSKNIQDNQKLIQQKIDNPSLLVVLIPISELIDEINNIIDKMNSSINQHNLRIDNRDKEKERIETEFWQIMRHDYDQIISVFKGVEKNGNEFISQKQQEINKLDELVEQKNKEIIQFQKNTINVDESISNINQGLIDIGITDFYIEKHQDNLYKLVREGRNDKIFSSLSEGEKMIISFLYFCELFKGKQNEKENESNKIAIIDDPVSSLSHIFVYNIGMMIKNNFFNSNNVHQVFVLTHSLYFFYELADSNHERRKKNQNLFRLSKNTTTSSIHIMKYEEIQNDYQSYWSVINDGNQPPALIANCMRNIIEYFFNFVQKTDLSNITQNPKLNSLRFQSFIRYINRESHSLGQNIFDFKEFNYEDFKEGLRLIFELMGHPEHYKKMSKIGLSKQ